MPLLIKVLLNSFLCLFLFACSSEKVNDENNNISEINNVQNKRMTVYNTTAMNNQLTFIDFQQRWNAVTSDLGTNLYIKHLEKQTNSENGDIYYCKLDEQNELRVIVNNDNASQLKMITTSKSTQSKLSMLNGWNQIINILHPNMELSDTDEVFNKIGVGPNAELTLDKPIFFKDDDIQYEIRPTETGYHFTASYLKKDES